jgi:uncharacterized protein
MRLRLAILPNRLAVCRLALDAVMPSWIRGTFTSVTRTRDELSIVCDDNAVPADVKAERDWRALHVVGPIPFEMTGVAAALVTPLAEAGISVFLVATFDTDYLLVKNDAFARAVDVLRGAGHDVVDETTIPSGVFVANDFL